MIAPFFFKRLRCEKSFLDILLCWDILSFCAVLGYFKAMRRIVDRYYGQKFRKIACQGNLVLLTLKTL